MKLKLSLLSGVLLLAGCVLLEPAAHGTFDVPAGTPASTVFACVENTLRAQQDGGPWNNVVTRRDAVAGVLETGDFARANIIGVRIRLEYQAATGHGTLRVKASGPYFADLGADQALQRLLAASCLGPVAGRVRG